MTGLNLPINIPWKFVASSPDMMDTSADDPALPYPWRSSLAIYAYEPDATDLDPELCDQRLIFLRVSASITGIQLTAEETKLLNDYANEPTIVYPDAPAQTIIENLIDAYYACYGVLLNVSVFANGTQKEVDLSDYPRIVDFEPKTRDLYQAATLNSEILSASHGDVRADKSMSTVESSETGLSTSISAPLGTSGATGTGDMSQKWGNTQNDSSTSSMDSSRDSRETKGTTTNITQMYNLLTGYHAGSNRATFFLQPRPHNLQPTNRRTFVNGLREIEGIQDFFLVVSRDKSIPGICVQARLETGHFPENAASVPISGAWEYKQQVIHIEETYTAHFGEQAKPALAYASAALEVDNWEFDPDKGDPGHGSVSQQILDDDDSVSTIQNDLRYSTGDGKLTVSASFKIDGPWNPVATRLVTFARDYTVFLRRRTVDADADTSVADPTTLVITQRSLGACLRTGENGCLSVDRGNERLPTRGVSVVDEIDFRVNDIERPGGAPDTRTFYRRLQGKMSSSFRRPSRRPPGITGLLDTNFIQKQLGRALAKDRKAAAVTNLLEARDFADKTLPENLTVERAVTLPLDRFTAITGLTMEEAVNVRRKLLGLPERRGRTDSNGTAR